MKIFLLCVSPVLGTLSLKKSLCVGPVLGTLGFCKTFLCVIDVNTLYWRTLSLRIFPLCVDPVLGTLRFYTIFPVYVPCAGDFEILREFPLCGGLMCTMSNFEI